MRLAAIATLVGLALADPVGPTLPWGVHIVYGEDPHTQMRVRWSTRTDVNASVAQVGLNETTLPWVFNGDSYVFTDVNNTQTIHTVYMEGLQADTQYFYRVGDGNVNWSPIFYFRTQPFDSPEYQPTVAIFGDMGVDVNAHRTLPLLYQEIENGAIDVILHIGDMAYDLDSNNGENGDEFVVNQQPYGAYIPVHMCPGNHESANDFFQYISRFDMMPGNQTGNSAFHSVNIGKAHVILFSSEAYFYVTPHGLPLLPQQYAWLEADLAAVNRTETPWIIAMAHRPLYCSPNDDNDDCHQLVSLIRDGIFGQYGMETLFYQYGVDVFFGAHEHSYERLYPVYQFMWDNTTSGQQAYIDYDRPIHILSGAAGCPENQDAWQTDGLPFSAVRLNIYGYGKLHILNESHAYWEMIDDATGDVADAMYFIRHQHGPYTSKLDEVPKDQRKSARQYAEEVAAMNLAEAKAAGRKWQKVTDSSLHPQNMGAKHANRHAGAIPKHILEAIATASEQVNA